MKKNLSAISVLMTVMLVLFMFAGCDMEDFGMGNQRPANSPDNSATNTHGVSSTLVPEGESVIEGFVEGQEIDEKDLPENILSAIKEIGENLIISGASYATYVGKQAYRVILSETGMGATREVYVNANGEVIPTETLTSATPGSSAGNGTENGAGSGTGSGNSAAAPSASPQGK